MTGGRLFVAGSPQPDPRALSNGLCAAHRRADALSCDDVLSLPPESLPDVAVIALTAAQASDFPAGLLARLTGLAAHVVFLAPAGICPPEGLGLRQLPGLDARGIGAVLDILSERDREALSASEHTAWHTAFLRAFPGIILACDTTRRVVFANASMAHRAGRDPEGMPCHVALHGREEPCPWCPRKEVAKGQAVSMEIQSPLDGRFFAATSAPLNLPDSPPLTLTLINDVTDRNMALARLKSLNRDLERRVTERTDTLARQAEELADANNRLRELDALKSGFLATVTHDLRTPLTSVLGFAKLTRRDFIKDFMPFSEVSDKLRRKGNRIADNLGIIETEGARLTRLVNDFLDLSKIESGRLNWNDQDTDPADVIRAAVAAVGGEYEQNERLALVVDIPGALPRLCLDPDRLMQVLVNLLTNAARYTGEGEVTLSAGRLPNGRMEFRVADTGPGIPAQERERIFDKFYQTRQGDTTATTKKGTGLGLAICKQIVERYGGVIRAEDRLPHGTVFVVELPTGRPDQGGGLTADEEPARPGLQPS
ncbi:histidine kinase [Solidesulfovibrio fructosivorans JJ]]|uniref:histidine kinase n=1 Tax=Solidesulfovibrio fructosivorans JJ] TaxID=596151 RepID=E1JTJ1_SOLFR|nr:PAS domain-containing sensor histidine kinase [Solidesulfovibrio fructosivorans]EFL52451.1 histidine kinase [Solidesulfovibrio fructosivorans JJ]]